jgi:hypothetical protein
VKDKFDELFELIKDPLPLAGVKTDNSIIFVYPPEKELDFREYLLDSFVPLLQAKNLSFRLLDLSGFVFEALDEKLVQDLREDEFDEYQWMKQGMSRQIERALRERVTKLAGEIPSGTIIIYSAASLYPLVRFGEVLRELRDCKSRIVLGFPGEERGGKLHFMNQPDGSNYLAIKIT